MIMIGIVTCEQYESESSVEEELLIADVKPLKVKLKSLTYSDLLCVFVLLAAACCLSEVSHL